MHEFVSFNHQILPAENPKIQSNSSAALYGKGVFTTIAIRNGQPFLWKKHWLRLTSNAEKIRLDRKKLEERKVLHSLYQTVKKNGVRNGRCRITFFDDSASKIWQSEQAPQIGILIQTADFQDIRKSISLAYSPYLINSTSPLAGIKSCNYMANILALDEAKTKGFDEAIRTNENGHITSACMANIFWLKRDQLFTPTLQTGCLNGTTREFIIENKEVLEVAEASETLAEADAMFLTSSGLGIVQVASLEEKKFAIEPHPITQILRNSSAAT